MWLMTTTGFYSIVEKPWDRDAGTLTVRARSRADLEALKASTVPALGDVKEDASADYRFRDQAPREAVVAAVAAQVQGLDYDNFKSAVATRQGHRRAALYHDVWEVLRGIGRVQR